MSLVKGPKIAVKKAKFFRNFKNKSRSILKLHKIRKNKNVPLNCYFSTKKKFRKIQVIFDAEN